MRLLAHRGRASPSLRAARAAIVGATMPAVLTACAGEDAADADLVATWGESGTERLRSFAADGSFATDDGAGGTWSAEDGYLVLEVEAGIFSCGDVRAETGYSVSAPFELEAEQLSFLEVTYRRLAAPAEETA